MWPDWALRHRALTRLELNQFAARPILARRILGLPVPRPDRFIDYSKAPCRKCGDFYVAVTLHDEPNGCGTYYEIRCDSCGDEYKTDGPDA